MPGEGARITSPEVLARIASSSFSAFLTQRFGEHVFASVDHNFSRERRTTEYINSRGLPQVYVDINRNLPDGTPNPEFLQAYSQGYRLRLRVGAQFALAEATLVLARLTRAFQVELAPGEKVMPTAVITTQPDHPAMFRLTQRMVPAPGQMAA